jgi:hypothetical protein
VAKYKRLPEAPETFHPEMLAEGWKGGDVFEEDYNEDQERAVVAAGWCEPTEKKKGDK